MHTPALDELIEIMKRDHIDYDPRRVASIILTVASDKAMKLSPQQLTEWIHQLAMDVLQ
jgi:hypothetical protein